MTTTIKKFDKQKNYETVSWKMMRYSAVALIPLVWIHVLIKDVIVGVNKYKLEKEDPIDTLEVDNTAVREAQLTRLAKLRSERNEAEVQQCLEAITKSCETGKGNLLEYLQCGAG